MPWLTSDDFLETLAKLRQRGLRFLLSKLVPSNLARTRSAFDDPQLQAANWWQVPAVRQRWSQKISGSAAIAYETHVADRYLAGRTGLRLLSLGSGACSHELAFARQPHFAEVRCVDIAGRLLQQAAETARTEGLPNFQTEVADVNQRALAPGSYDVVLFHSALHHFRDVAGIVARVRTALAPGGLLILNDYVGPACNGRLPSCAKPTACYATWCPPATASVFFPGSLSTTLAAPAACACTWPILPRRPNRTGLCQHCGSTFNP